MISERNRTFSRSWPLMRAANVRSDTSSRLPARPPARKDLDGIDWLVDRQQACAGGGHTEIREGSTHPAHGGEPRLSALSCARRQEGREHLSIITVPSTGHGDSPILGLATMTSDSGPSTIGHLDRRHPISLGARSAPGPGDTVARAGTSRCTASTARSLAGDIAQNMRPRGPGTGPRERRPASFFDVVAPFVAAADCRTNDPPRLG